MGTSMKFALFAAAMGVLWGCAEERDLVDRVQPYALEKSFFVGEDLVGTQDDPEFYYQGTLIDVGYGAAQDGLFTSTYAQPLSRIKWQITEDLLIGRIAYERIDGSDGKGLGGPVQNGVVAVAYRIKSPFDIARQYNAGTGEEYNIVGENTSDRPWNEREHFRVDFSESLATDAYDFDTLSLLGVYGGISYESLGYEVTDPADPDAPFFDTNNGYFDVTNKAFAKPGEIDLRSFGWGIDSFPSCFLPNDFLGGSEPAGSCNPVELTIRQSFKRVRDDDYEPAHWDGYRFQAFGAFYVERRSYSGSYGMLDTGWRRFISRYNIWERSHYYSDPENMTGAIACYTEEDTPFGEGPERDTDGNGTDDECEEVTAALGVGGSQCDRWNHKCTQPYTKRREKPVVWYYTNGSDPYYYEASADAANQWDVGLRMAVQAAKYSECRHTNSDNCKNSYPMHFGQQDMQDDLIYLSTEVDKCRYGTAYADKGKNEEECKTLAESIGKARGYDDAVIKLAQMREMVIICHSPVQADDHAACAPADQRLPAGVTAEMCYEASLDSLHELYETCKKARNVRRGDLRYNQLNVLPDPQTPSPWGIMVDANDPLNGKVVSSSINVWAFVNDLFSQKVIDMIRYAKGELSTEQITSGEYVRNWAGAAAAASAGSLSGALDKEEVLKRTADMARTTPEQIAAIQANPGAIPPKLRNVVQKVKQQVKAVRTKWDAPSVMRPIYAARAQQAYGSEFEAQLMTPAMQQMMGVQGMPLSDSVMNHASILRGANPSFQRDLKQWKEVALAERGACILQEAPAPVSLTGLGDILEQKFSNKFGPFNPSDSPDLQQERAEAMRLYLARKAHTAVIAHEMGHSIGLRHNFVSSADSFGYRPQYWQLRTNDGKVTEECTDLQTDGQGCVGPRYFDPMTENERRNLIWMWMHSSVMDYAGEPAQDMLGLSAYDFAATRMFYGESVAVFKDESFNMKDSSGKAFSMLEKMDNFGGITGYSYGLKGTEFHYSQLNKNYNLIDSCVTISNPSVFRPDSWNDDLDGAWHPILDGHLVTNPSGDYTRCKQQEVDYVPWRSLRDPYKQELKYRDNDGNNREVYYRGGPALDSTRRLRVPYGFGTDGWADTGNLSVYRHDNGADPYELFDFFISQQEVNHILDNYRRERSGFSVRSAANRTLGRYNSKMRDGAKGLGLMANYFRMGAELEGVEFESLWRIVLARDYAANILAAGLAFDHFTRTLARPEAGLHYNDNGILRADNDSLALFMKETSVVIPNGATSYADPGSNVFDSFSYGGKLVENALAEDRGEYDSSFTMNCGSYYDKIYAPMLMAESVDNFISASRSDFVDPRYRSVSMADLFPEGYRRWLANNLTGDDFIKGPRLVVNDIGNPLLDDRQFPAHPMGWTSWWGETPRVCFPDDNVLICDSYNDDGTDYHPLSHPKTAPIDPQVGWEQQKFIIAMTLLYLPENEKQRWINSMRIWERGEDSDPLFENRIEFHDSAGKIYVAHTEGMETIFGKRVQKGIAARILQYANELMSRAYNVDDGPDLDGDGVPDWYLPIYKDDGTPSVKYDAEVGLLEVDEESGGWMSVGDPNCTETDSSGCTCQHNRACLKLNAYLSVPFFLRQAMHAYGLTDPEPRGIF